MSEEEKKAIELTKTIIEFAGDSYIPKENRKALQVLLNIIETQQKEINKFKQENHNLNQELEAYIPRRRVRRVYKMIGKILKQDGITDDLDDLLEE